MAMVREVSSLYTFDYFGYINAWFPVFDSLPWMNPSGPNCSINSGGRPGGKPRCHRCLDRELKKDCAKEKGGCGWWYGSTSLSTLGGDVRSRHIFYFSVL